MLDGKNSAAGVGSTGTVFVALLAHNLTGTPITGVFYGDSWERAEVQDGCRKAHHFFPPLHFCWPIPYWFVYGHPGHISTKKCTTKICMTCPSTLGRNSTTWAGLLERERRNERVFRFETVPCSPVETITTTSRPNHRHQPSS